MLLTARVSAAQLRDHGLPLRTARVSALRQLVLAVPAPVIADALGFHHTTTTRQHVNAGATWSRYVAGERPGQATIPARTAMAKGVAGLGLGSQLRRLSRTTVVGTCSR